MDIIALRNNAGTNGYIPRLKCNRVKKTQNGLRFVKISRESKRFSKFVYSGVY